MKSDQECHQNYSKYAGLLIILGILFLHGTSLQAHLIEPDNIIYGEIFTNEEQKITSDSEARVSLEVNQIELASYTMGDNPSAGDYYILRVPLDSEQPAAPDRAQISDIAIIKVNGWEVLAINDIAGSAVTVGARGTVVRKKLSVEYCVPTNGGVEICDGEDNDCDGDTDEDFDLQNDSNNCGSCGHVCTFTHAAALCSDSQCVMGACEAGWVDLDGDSGNGCEHPCSPTNGGVEICDGEDNDCDGDIDEEGAVNCQTYYKDHDNDGYGVSDDSKCLCQPDEANEYRTLQPGDINDNDPAIGAGNFILSPDNIDFGDVMIGQTATRSLIIINNGNDDVLIEAVTYQGSGFTVSIQQVVIGAGKAEQFSINFTPSIEGQVSDSIDIYGSGTQRQFTFTGNGTTNSNILSIGSVTRNIVPGSDAVEVTVPINLNLDIDLSQLFFTVSYDTSIFDTDFNRVEIEDARITVTPSSDDITIHDDIGLIEIGVVNFGGGAAVTSGEGRIINLGFIITNPRIGSFPVFTQPGTGEISVEGTEVNLAGRHGEINLVQQCSGDIDKDNKFNVKDLILIYRSMFYVNIAPSSWRQQDPDYLPDTEIGAIIADNWDCFDVDKGSTVNVNDIIYMYRSMFYVKVVPDLHRDFNPAIPPDEEIRGRVEGLDPSYSDNHPRMRARALFDIDGPEDIIYLDNVVGSAGSSVNVPVRLNISNDLSQIFFRITYPPQLVDPNRVEIESSRIVVQSGPDDIELGNGTIGIGFINFGGGTAVTSGQGKILDIIFDIKPDVSVPIPISIEFISAMETGGRYIESMVEQNGSIQIDVCPEAQFTASVTSVCPGGVIDFYDQSSNAPISWEWHFGDGTGSYERNPSHLYQTAGVYTVSLSVGNSCGTDTETKTEYITIYDLGGPCTVGVGACQRTGVVICNAAGTGTECSVVPGVPVAEVCDGVDNNCNTFTDEEGAIGCTNYYMDADGDTYGVDGNFRCLCNPNPINHYTAFYGGDPDDTNPEVVGDVITLNLNFPSGWSMFSLPVDPADKRMGAVVPGAIVFQFKNKYEIVDEYDNLEVGVGYWGYVTEETTYSVTGVHIYSYALDLPNGWSMIGSCPSPAVPTVDSGTIRAVFSYNGKYNLLGSDNNIILQPPGEGFWINLSEQTTLRVQTY